MFEFASTSTALRSTGSEEEGAEGRRGGVAEWRSVCLCVCVCVRMQAVEPKHEIIEVVTIRNTSLSPTNAPQHHLNRASALHRGSALPC